jgi:hypothetical protein
VTNRAPYYEHPASELEKSICFLINRAIILYFFSLRSRNKFEISIKDTDAVAISTIAHNSSNNISLAIISAISYVLASE